MKAIETLKALQLEELNNNFANGDLYNELEDLIYKLENPITQLQSVQGETYASKTMQVINKNRGL
jgi:hypothetical protein